MVIIFVNIVNNLRPCVFFFRGRAKMWSRVNQTVIGQTASRDMIGREINKKLKLRNVICLCLYANFEVKVDKYQ